MNWWGEEIQPEGVNIPSVPHEPLGALRWASQKKASIDLFNEQKQGRTFTISGRIYSPVACVIQIKIKDNVLWSSSLLGNQFHEFDTSPQILKSGEARIDIISDAAPVVLNGRKVSFGMADLKIDWR